MAEADTPAGVVKSIRNDADAVVLELCGDVDMARSVELRERLREVLSGKPKLTVVNLAQVGFMDSSGLATLVEALQISRRSGGELRLADLAVRVRSVFEIARLDTVFKIYASEAEALA